MFNNQIRKIRVETKSLELLNNRLSAGSLLETDQFSSDEMHRFWLNFRNIQELLINGSEEFPGKVLRPSSENITLLALMLDLIIEYYMAIYVLLEF